MAPLHPSINVQIQTFHAGAQVTDPNMRNVDLHFKVRSLCKVSETKALEPCGLSMHQALCACIITWAPPRTGPSGPLVCNGGTRQ